MQPRPLFAATPSGAPAVGGCGQAGESQPQGRRAAPPPRAEMALPDLARTSAGFAASSGPRPRWLSSIAPAPQGSRISTAAPSTSTPSPSSGRPRRINPPPSARRRPAPPRITEVLVEQPRRWLAGGGPRRAFLLASKVTKLGPAPAEAGSRKRLPLRYTAASAGHRPERIRRAPRKSAACCSDSSSSRSQPRERSPIRARPHPRTTAAAAHRSFGLRDRPTPAVRRGRASPPLPRCIRAEVDRGAVGQRGRARQTKKAAPPGQSARPRGPGTPDAARRNPRSRRVLGERRGPAASRPAACPLTCSIFLPSNPPSLYVSDPTSSATLRPNRRPRRLDRTARPRSSSCSGSPCRRASPRGHATAWSPAAPSAHSDREPGGARRAWIAPARRCRRPSRLADHVRRIRRSALKRARRERGSAVARRGPTARRPRPGPRPWASSLGGRS